jgi:hypothetical protein
MTKMKKQRESTKISSEIAALHEAAHAYYLVYGKVGLQEVSLKDGYCRPSVTVMFEHNYINGLKGYLAGPAACLMHGIPLNHQCNSADFRQARRLIKCFRKDLSKEEIQTYLEKMARRIYRQLKTKHHVKVAKIADALLEKKFLTARQVNTILKNS